mmetsp:Transcript_42855/g.126977  ORF Transcript_42855/g.126977 Transcript_42855/m.126977 type:complete len:288 (+) Transcript_42855:1116-1979(+)
MEARRILVGPDVVVVAELAEPVPLLPLRGDQKPDARNDVVDHQQRHNHLDDVREDADLLRVDHVADIRQHLLELQQAQQPDHPDQAQDPHEPDGVARARRLRALRRHHRSDREGPVRPHRQQVDQEPARHVVPQDRPRMHHGHPLLHEACERLQHHVESPEEQREPVHEDGEGDPRGAERLQRDVDEVEPHECSAEDVPRNFVRVARVADEVPHEAVVAARDDVAHPLVVVVGNEWPRRPSAANPRGRRRADEFVLPADVRHEVLRAAIPRAVATVDSVFGFLLAGE